MNARWLALVLALASLAPARSQTLEGRVTKHVLKNGMTFLLMERHQSPTISFHMRFRVGSVDECTGNRGMAHLLEHMLFKGTRTLGTKDFARERPTLDEIEKLGDELDAERLKGEAADKKRVSALEAQLKALTDKVRPLIVKDEIDETYSRNGGVGFNATTNQDLTTYMVSLPSNRFELWARIESDRMANPVLREFYSERDVIQEERRMRTDSNPTGMLWEQFQAAAFTAHPYGDPVIGWMSEIRFLSKRRTEQFLRTFYAPNNTVTAIVGDFDTARAIALVDRYFERIPSQLLPGPNPCVEPDQIGERRVMVERDASPVVLLGFHKPAMPSRDDYVFDVISSLLTDGRTSRLYKKLVKQTQIAVSVGSSSSFPGNRYSNLFVVSAMPRAPHTPSEVEQSIVEELDRLASEPVTRRELEKVQNQLEADFIRGLLSNGGLASELSYYQVMTGDWRYVENHPKVIRTITETEVQKVAARYLTASNRTVATLVRPQKGGVRRRPAPASPSPAPGAPPSAAASSSPVTTAPASPAQGGR